MIVLPAIDLLNQKVVRLFQGDYQQQQVFGDDPVRFAQEFEKSGATHLHLVDLAGAKEGSQRHFEIAEKIVKETNLFVELGGGIRDEASIEACLAAGVQRVILGTVAQAEPALTQALLKKYGEKIAVGVDARDGKVAVEGWLKTTETSAYDFCETLGEWGCRNIIYTEISQDGTGEGVVIEPYERLVKLPLAITASGGVSSLADIEQLKALDLYGVIVGKALYNNTLQLGDVLTVAKGGRP